MLPCESGCTGSYVDGKLDEVINYACTYCLYVAQMNSIHGFELSFQTSKSYPLFSAPGVTIVTHEYVFSQCYRGGTAKFRPVIPADVVPKTRPRTGIRRSTRGVAPPLEYLGINSRSPTPIVLPSMNNE